MTFAPHTKLARYEIVSPIGADGMGEVYLAKDTRLNRKVALKVLPADVATNQERMRRFEQEACTASALSHPNIAHIYEIGESDGTNFIAMEFVEGATLRETIHGEQVDLKTLLKYLGQVADGLAKAHVARIVHRDLKPENIMISRDGFAKILDFGLAKLIDRQLPAPGEPNSEAATAMLPEPLSAPGMIMGTVGYMSPEQARGKKEIDGRSDIFSFGCILYEAATGRQPFAGETAIDSLHKIIYAQPPSIKDFNKNAPPDLQRIVRRCLRKDPEERYQTIKDVAIEIKELRREMKSEAKTELSIAPEKVATSNASKSENRTLIEDEKTAAATAGQVAHSTSSAEYLVSQIGQHKKAVAFVAIAALVAVAGLIFGLYKFYGSRQLSTAAAPLRVTPLTSFPSVERNPALSPDGKQVAYVWMGEKGDNYDIYVKITDAGTPLRLTTDPEREMSPAWSPDSRFVAFRRGRGEKKGFYIVPALGGAERKIADAYEWNQSGLQQQAVDWSPDGKTLAVVDKTSENEPWSIFLLSIETGEKRRLTTPPAQIRGDVLAAFSPDGKTLAFARTNALDGNIFLVPVAGGEPSQVTFNETSSLLGLDWTSDGERLVFSSETAGRLALWTIPVSGGTSEPVAGVGENVFDLSVSPQDNRLVYAQISVDVNLWRIEIANPADSGRQNANPPTKIISSTRIEEQPQISPNGQRIAFRSNRSGSNEIWVSDSEGQNALQLTNFGGSFPNRPRWSPDGRFIAFNLNAGGNADIFVTSADGGSPRRLTTEATEETEPSWSRDGRYIYFSSKRTGRNEIWKMPAAGGEAVQVTREGGVISSESSDGRVLYYTKARIEEGLWTVSTKGGAETKVLDYRIGQNFAVVEQGIYFFSYPAGGRGPYTIEFFDFANRQTTRLATLTELAGPFAVTGITISPDQQWIVYAQRDKLDFDLMLVENFR